MNSHSKLSIATFCSLAVAVTLALYGRTLWFGFDYSDYHFISHYTWAEVGHAWIGNWESKGLEPHFYRPLTATFHALRVWLFGFDPIVLHGLGLGLFALSAVLFGSWLQALGLPRAAVIPGLLVYLIHPAMPSSAVVWITNQMHDLQLIVILGALLIATKGSRHWPWILALQAVGLLIKEDTIVCGALVAAVWWWHGVPLPRRWLIGSVIVVVLYCGLRVWALAGEFGNYARPDLLANLIRGPLGMVLVTYDRQFYQPILYALGTLAFVGFAAATIRGVRPVILPAVLVVLTNAPYALASWPNRWQLLVLCTAFTVAWLLASVPERARRLGMWAAAILIGILAAGSVFVTTRMEPCGTMVTAHDARVRAWGDKLDPEMRALLDAKNAQCLGHEAR